LGGATSVTKYYALVGEVSGELLTYGGLVLVHPEKRELEYLFPALRVVELPKFYLSDGMTMPLKDHPDMDSVVFPLDQNMDQFKVHRK
jgi:hypothetical protein